MVHRIYNLDASYWTVASGNLVADLVTNGMVGENTQAYIFDPTAHDDSGFDKSTANMTKEQFNAYFTILTAGQTVIPNAENFEVSNWDAKGWGSTAEDILLNYNKFIENNFLNGLHNLAINAESLPLQTLVVSGTISGTTYFLPIAIYGQQGDLAVTAATAPAYIGGSDTLIWFKPDDLTGAVGSTQNLVDNSSGNSTPVVLRYPGSDGKITSATLNGFKSIGRPFVNETVRWEIDYNGGNFHTYIMVVTYDSTLNTGQAQITLNTGYNNIPAYQEIRYDQNPARFGPGGGLTVGNGTYTFPSIEVDSVSHTLVSPVILVVELNQTRGRVWRNGTLVGTTGSSVSSSPMYYPNFALRDAFLHELVIMNISLTDNERQDVEKYLAKKYDLGFRLPIGHPGK